MRRHIRILGGCGGPAAVRGRRHGDRPKQDIPDIEKASKGKPLAALLSRSGANKASDGVPFVYEELVARIRAVIRRSARPIHRTIAVNGLTIDLASRTVRVEGERVCLSAKEYELLIALAEEPDRVFHKEDLLR
jgi:hypothetical protein